MIAPYSLLGTTTNLGTSEKIAKFCRFYPVTGSTASRTVPLKVSRLAVAAVSTGFDSGRGPVVEEELLVVVDSNKFSGLGGASSSSAVAGLSGVTGVGVVCKILPLFI